VIESVALSLFRALARIFRRHREILVEHSKCFLSSPGSFDQSQQTFERIVSFAPIRKGGRIISFQKLTTKVSVQVMLRRVSISVLCMATSKFRFTSVRGMTAAATTTAAAAADRKRSLIIDTDCGFDDLVALQCLLNTRHPPPLLVTTVGGVVSAPRGAGIVRGLFPKVQIAAGLNAPIMPYDPIPAWLVDYRTNTLDAFCQDMNIPTAGVGFDNLNCDHDNNIHTGPKVAVPMILDSRGDNSVDILCIGPLTNLSGWLTYCQQQDQDGGNENQNVEKRFASKINSIYIMGGNHPSLAHTLQHEPEFNFGLDPAAAHHVVSSPLLRDKIHLVTSSVCNMAKLNDASLAGGKERIQEFVEKQRNQHAQQKQLFYPTLLQYDVSAYSLSCDPVCAFALERPECVTWEHVWVRVEADSGNVVAAHIEDRGMHESSEGSMIRMASDINLKEYLSWITTTVHSNIRE
jgi:inosine-uridine nucleoside N-ribohydrolase